MSEQVPEEEAPETPVDYLNELQSVVANFDPDAMVLNLITIVEWLEPDGSYSMSTIHTPMPIWHMRGLLGWAEDVADIPVVTVRAGDCTCGECEE